MEDLIANARVYIPARPLLAIDSLLDIFSNAKSVEGISSLIELFCEAISAVRTSAVPSMIPGRPPLYSVKN